MNAVHQRPIGTKLGPPTFGNSCGAKVFRRFEPTAAFLARQLSRFVLWNERFPRRRGNVERSCSKASLVQVDMLTITREWLCPCHHFCCGKCWRLQVRRRFFRIHATFCKRFLELQKFVDFVLLVCLDLVLMHCDGNGVDTAVVLCVLSRICGAWRYFRRFRKCHRCVFGAVWLGALVFVYVLSRIGVYLEVFVRV